MDRFSLFFFKYNNSRQVNRQEKNKNKNASWETEMETPYYQLEQRRQRRHFCVSSCVLWAWWPWNRAPRLDRGSWRCGYFSPEFAPRCRLARDPTILCSCSSPGFAAAVAASVVVAAADAAAVEALTPCYTVAGWNNHCCRNYPIHRNLELEKKNTVKMLKSVQVDSDEIVRKNGIPWLLVAE